MFGIKLLWFLYLMKTCFCDWSAEWMTPIQEQLFSNNDPSRRTNKGGANDLKVFNDDEMLMVPVTQDSPEHSADHKVGPMFQPNPDSTSVNLKIRLETTLRYAENILENLKAQIVAITNRETLLKEAIVNGRSGLTTVSVSTLGNPLRVYLIREGVWTVCNGMIQFPTAAASLYSDMFAVPRCIGQEIPTGQDPCAFNSVIKYETVPTRRKLVYSEEEYLCLKPSFNSSLEQYLSVPKHVVNDTCKHGIIRSLDKNTEECGVRVMSEYTYYPYRGSAATLLPLEYCTEKDGTCKLIVAWHVSNSSIENFEFLKDENNFKKSFIKKSPFMIERTV